jgi:outer membrane protein assembly factor BamA
LRGSRALTATVELRLPLALVGESLGTLPVGADKVSLSLFSDVGDAWDRSAELRLTRLRSLGAELVGDVTYLYDLPLRVRLGAAVPLTGGPARAYLALGTDF